MAKFDIDNITKDINQEISHKASKTTKAKGGRPKSNPYDQDKQLTVRMPTALHRQLRLAAADQEKTMNEIAVSALLKQLKKYEGK